MAISPVQIGWIPYWNLLPLQHELRRISGGTVNMLSGHPTTVNKWLQDGHVSVAPASSIALLKSPRLELALPLGIASEGAVLSVYLGVRGDDRAIVEFIRGRQTELAGVFADACRRSDDPGARAGFIWSEVASYRPASMRLPALRLTSASAASAALTRVLLHLWFGEAAAGRILSTASVSDRSVAHDMDEAVLELVIGDEALQRRHEFRQIIDLGQTWFELTQLPFVFGLWQSNSKSMNAGLKSMLMDAASLAEARMVIEPQIYVPAQEFYCGNGEPVDLASYWKVIHYRLGERHFRSLLLYYALYLRMRGHQEHEHDNERVTRWSRTWTQRDLGGMYL
jgi:predicted solute-binding protein